MVSLGGRVNALHYWGLPRRRAYIWAWLDTGYWAPTRAKSSSSILTLGYRRTPEGHSSLEILPRDLLPNPYLETIPALWVVFTQTLTPLVR